MRYNVINTADDLKLFEITLNNISDIQVFVWKMFELYSVNVAIMNIEQSPNNVYIRMFDINTDIPILKLETNQTEYDSLKYPLM